MGSGSKRFVFVAAVVAAAVALGVASSSTGAAPRAAATKGVTIKDDFFTPKTIHVAVGGKVKWSWRGEGDSHNVTFRKVPKGASKRHSRTRTSGSFTRSFSKRGTYRFVCTIHQDLGMKGTVVAG